LLASFILPCLVYLIFFWWLDHSLQYRALISQFILAIVVCALLYFSMRSLLYDIRIKCKRIHFLPNWVLPLQIAFIFAPWFVLLIHPLLVSGNILLPWEVAIPLALFIILYGLLICRPVRASRFSLAHSWSIYLYFPEEGTRVCKGIYSYIRHPGYAMVIYVCLGLGTLRNNLSAILTALIYAIPIFLEIQLEDKEIIERFGEEHRCYVKEIPAIFPRLRDIRKLFKFIILGKNKK
jgi:protein-S-isoprenylcysteine O-methyltransferase Ste14